MEEKIRETKSLPRLLAGRLRPGFVPASLGRDDVSGHGRKNPGKEISTKAFGGLSLLLRRGRSCGGHGFYVYVALREGYFYVVGV